MDKYAELREALEAGPTPGPWTVRYDYVVQATSFDGGRLVPVAQPYGVNSDGTDLFANARMIAACHPEAIRALLAERDALREALDLVNDLSSQEWQDQNGKRMAATGNDGKRFWFITDDVIRVVRAALAQKQGEKHDNRT